MLPGYQTFADISKPDDRRIPPKLLIYTISLIAVS